MASKGKSRSGVKSQSPTPAPGHGRRSAKGRESKAREEDEKETLAFKVLSAEYTKILADIEDIDELQEKAAEILQITKHSTDLKDGSTLDFYVAGLWWAKEQGYNLEQMSGFFTVLHTLLGNVKDKQLTLIDNLKEFKKMLVGIGVEPNPETPIKSGGLDGIFDLVQAKAITEYVHTSFFQHYKLYEFMYCHTQAEEIIGTDLILEVPLPASMPWPPPLDEGVSEDLYRQYIATPPPTPEDKEAVDGEGAEGDADENDEGAEAKTQREADILAQLSADEIKDIMDSVFKETLSGLEAEVAAKLREKENAYITRINKIHKVAD